MQPKGREDGTIPSAVMIDEPQLEVLKDKERVMVPVQIPIQTISLGQLVKDPVRGMTGTATGRAVYLNGCSRILVEPKGEQSTWWVDEKQLIGKKTFITNKDKKVIKADNTSTSNRPGGPARSSSKF